MLLIKQMKQIKQNSSQNQQSRFIPFLRQRDDMGRLIRPKTTFMKSSNKPTDIFQNLKKTTHEYLFYKQYKKLQRKLHQTNAQLYPKDYDYEKAINYCIKCLPTKKTQQRTKFYMELKNQIDDKIQNFKRQIKSSPIQQSLKNNNITKKQHIQKQKKNLFQKNSRSALMMCFTECGKKYKKNIHQKRQDSWQKWYQTKSVDLFPGKTVKIKQLKKSLYNIDR